MKPIHGPERVVELRAQEKADSVLGRRDAGRRWWHDEVIDLLKRAVEAVEYPVELDGHLEGRGVACGVVRPDRGAAGIGEVVGVVLRLEHIEHVGAKRLRGLHDVRTLGIRLAGDREVGRGPLDLDAGPEQGVDELRRGQKVGLVGRQNVASWVTASWGVEEAFKLRQPRRARPVRPSTTTAPPRPPRPLASAAAAGPPWAASTTLGVMVQLSRLPRSIALWPISQML